MDRPRLHLWWIAAAAVLGALGAAYWTRHREPHYRVECLLEYGREPGSLPSAPAELLLSEEWYRTQDFLLASTAIATRVVDELGLDQDRSFLTSGVRERSGGPRRPVRKHSERSASDAVEKLRASMTVTRIEGTHLVRIAIEDADPKRAARIANAVGDVYLRKSVEDRTASTERAVTWLSEQVAATSSRLIRTEDELQTFFERQQPPALPLPERQALLTEEIKSLHQRLVDARVQRIELAARVAKLKAAAQNPNPFEIRAEEFDQSDLVKQLRMDYLALVIKQRELAAAKTPSATRGQASENKVAQSARDDAGVDGKASHGVVGDAQPAERKSEEHPASADPAQGGAPHDPNEQAMRVTQATLTALWEAMQAAIAGVVRSAQAELAAAQQIEAHLQATLDQANAAGRELQQQQLEYNRLERERAEAESLLKALRERSTTAGVATASGLWNAKIVEPATPPSHPAALPVLLNAGLGAVLGSLLAVNMLLLLRFFRTMSKPPGSEAAAAAIQELSP